MIPAGVMIEILIVGIVVAIAISPLFHLILPNQEKTLTSYATDIAANHKELAVLFILIIYILGIIGNRISDDVTEQLYDLPGIKLLKFESLKSDIWGKEALYKEFKTLNENTKLEGKEVYKLLEFRVIDNREGISLWFERHKSFVRILRAISFFSLIMIALMLTTKFAQDKRNTYSWRAYAMVLLVFSISHYSWRAETYKYQERVGMSCMKIIKDCMKE